MQTGSEFDENNRRAEWRVMQHLYGLNNELRYDRYVDIAPIVEAQNKRFHGTTT